MRPVDPRLVREARAARSFLVMTTALGLLTAGLVLAQAALLAHVLAHAGDGGRALSGSLVALAVVLVLRAAAVYGGEAAAVRAAAAVTSELRRKLVRHTLALGPQWSARTSPGELTTLVTRGLDALAPYFSRYLPQLVLACIVPVAVLARIAGADLVSAIVIAFTLPLIPVFMALVGMHTRARTERQWRLLATLGGHFLDVIQGLPTLKLFGRARAQAALVASVTEEHRQATMSTLRVAFLSALVLELLSTLSVALVAVEVGLRLLSGGMPYETALMVLLLAPEAYLPLRAVGTQFHASMEGAVAATAALDVLDLPLPPVGTGTAIAARPELALVGVSFVHPGRTRHVLEDVDLVLTPSCCTAVVGPSGAGKSTLLSLLLGLQVPTSGVVTLDGIDLSELDRRDWHSRIGWVPQSPHLFVGTVGDNVRLGCADASDAQVWAALDEVGADFVRRLPRGLDTPVGERGRTLSTGQRQRVALARVVLRDPAVLLLDEPGAHLDVESDLDLRDAVRRLLPGRTVVIVTHQQSWASLASRVLHLSDGRLTDTAPAMAA